MSRTVAFGAGLLLLISPLFATAQTVAELQAQLEVLFAQIAALQAQIGQAEGGQAPSGQAAPVSSASATHATHAMAHRGKNGQSFSYQCPPNVGTERVWGSGTYSDDSSICNAGIHAGAITRASGGTVTITIQAGRSSYSGSANNGVTTLSWNAWPGSYTVVTSGQSTGQAADPGAAAASAQTTAEKHRGQNGVSFRYSCPANVASAVVWGSGTYTDDSSICNAAIHAGVIQRAVGGVITITIKPGQSSYGSSAQNGVTSAAWGEWNGSFTVQ
jgi:hypothetical protein